MSEQLKQFRAQIDSLDDELLKLVNRRAALAQQIGLLKEDGTVLRPEREAQILRRVKENNPGPLAGESVAKLFREIMSACLALEKPLKVAFLGPEGTFTQAAAVKHFGHAANTYACASIDEVFRNVEAGSADYGVVPVEIPLAARWAPRWTCCWKPRSRYAARSTCACTSSCCANPAPRSRWSRYIPMHSLSPNAMSGSTCICPGRNASRW